SCGAITVISFCRALKTRQRAVSSVMPSTWAICRNDRPSSARRRKAARNSAGRRPTARASRCSAPRLSARSPGPPPPAGEGAGGGQVLGNRRAGPGGHAPLVGEAVVADAEEPGPEVGPRPERVERRERLEERLLGQVLGSVAVVGQVVEPAVQPVPVAFHQS